MSPSFPTVHPLLCTFLRSLSLLGLLVLVSTSHAQTFRLTPIHYPDAPYYSTYVTDLNDLGQVVGSQRNFVESRAFVWSPQTGFRFLPSLPDLFPATLANGINNLGYVTGSQLRQENTSFYSNPVVWSPDGTPHALPTLPQTLSSAGADINDRNQVIASSAVRISEHRVAPQAFYWSEATGSLPLPGYGMISDQYAYDINNQGEVLGIHYENGVDPYLWTEETGIQPLHLGRLVELTALNDAGLAVGAQLEDPFLRAYAAYWTEETGLQLLSAPFGSSRALDVNNRGQIAGWYRTSFGSTAAALWDTHGGFLDLQSHTYNATDWLFYEALAINERGQILGTGFQFNAGARAFVLTPVPEPGSVMFLSGMIVTLGGIAFARRRSRRM
jgi:uncharacterized membrane protein